MWTYLWQNFLNNQEVIDFIVDDIKKNADLSLNSIEIWPWKWALTKYLNFIENLKVFEKDETFYELLQKYVKKENIIMWDFLSADLEKHIKTNFFNAFWNLPYYITSPIFRKLTHPENKKKMKYWIFMIQKEVWEKIKTDAGKKSMLYFLLNYNYKITYLKTVPAEDFDPAPKVDSCLVWFEYHWKNENIDFEKFQKLLTILTAYKRKTLWKIHKILEKQNKEFYITDEISKKRIQELTWEDIKIIVENSDLKL